MKVILITGTKGKTTLSLTLNNALLSIGKKVLCISSEGIFKNGKIIKDNEYFLKKFKTSANVCALNEVRSDEARRFDYVILESSFSSGKNIRESFAKNNIDLAILTNVYWDHIDGERIKDQKDLLERKLKLIGNLKKGGTAFIYAGDKKNSVSYKAISKLRKNRNDLSVVAYNKRLFHSSSDQIGKCYMKNDCIYLNDTLLLKISSASFPAGIRSEISESNLIAITGILKSLKIGPEILKKKSVLSVPGRFNLFDKNGYTVVLDYAHEIKSISEAAKTLRLKFKGRHLKAVIRLSYYRKEGIIRDLTRKIAPLFDSYIIYDKAISRPSLRKIFTRDKKAGSVAKMMLEELKKEGAVARIINDELTAIRKSIRKLKKDEILYIIGDQIKKDISVIKEELQKK
ncbi:MAG: hypothetical protein HGB08_04200 [Candidatus Moranbacteria bacterium]|nr:hypothetical protein [Candidatus Moranbacteria bacterium]